MKNGNPLPDDDHVLRYVPWTRLIKDDDDETIIGVYPQAFELKEIDHEMEDYLSVNWIDYFSGNQIQKIEHTVQSARTAIKVGSKSAFCLARVSDIKAACSSHGIKARIYYQKNKPNNPSHSAISHTTNDHDLLTTLTNTFGKPILNSNIP